MAELRRNDISRTGLLEFEKLQASFLHTRETKLERSWSFFQRASLGQARIRDFAGIAAVIPLSLFWLSHLAQGRCDRHADGARYREQTANQRGDDG
jgi:hypothetical protein